MLAVQFLYQQEFHPESDDLEEDWLCFTEELKPPAKAAEFGRMLVRGVMKNLPDFNARLVRMLENWDLKRVGLVEKNILRLALFELLHRPDIPPVVALNEAVELAKELSGDDAGKFVNGLLDRVLKTLNRPLRAPVGGKDKSKPKVPHAEPAPPAPPAPPADPNAFQHFDED